MPVTINGTTGIAGPDGSASTPAVQGTDSNTGLFYPAADTVALSTGGSERLRITSAGNVGIGTSSPSTSLHVVGSSSAITATVSSTSTTINGAPSLKVINTGSSTTNQLAEIQFRYEDGALNANGAIAALRESGTARGQSFIFAPSDSLGNPTERMRIDSSGNVLVGKTSLSDSTAGIQLRTQGVYAVGCTSSGSEALMLNRNTSDGTIASIKRGNTEVGTISVTTSATAYNTSSDYRLKENVQPMTNALATVAQLNPVTYTWKSTGEAGQGFIAHELQAVVPDAVTGEKDAIKTERVEVSPAVPATYDEEGNELTPAVEAVFEDREVPDYQGVDTSFLVATLAAAIQELKAIVDAQAARISALEAA